MNGGAGRWMEMGRCVNCKEGLKEGGLRWGQALVGEREGKNIFGEVLPLHLYQYFFYLQKVSCSP